MIEFLGYLVDSGRIARSAWWNVVDRSIVQGSLTAWKIFKLNQRIYRPVSPLYAPYSWQAYIRGGVVAGAYSGGTWRQAWTAHQKGLWAGVQSAASLVQRETFEERIFMWKVLNNVEFYSRTGVDLDGALGFGIALGSYPRRYPARDGDACRAVLIADSYAWYVRQFYPEPRGWWANYCEPIVRRLPPVL